MDRQRVQIYREKFSNAKQKLGELQKVFSSHNPLFIVKTSELIRKPSVLFSQGLNLTDALEISMELITHLEPKSFEDVETYWSLMNRLEGENFPEFKNTILGILEKGTYAPGA
jgi:hypothetical protein